MHQQVEAGSNITPPPSPLSAQYMGRIYRSASGAKRAAPSRASSIQRSVATTGSRPKAVAERFTRAQCASKSGKRPPMRRAPSKTVEASHAPWVRGPMMATLPSCHSPSKKVQVWEIGARVATTWDIFGSGAGSLSLVRKGKQGHKPAPRFCLTRVHDDSRAARAEVNI